MNKDSIVIDVISFNSQVPYVLVKETDEGISQFPLQTSFISYGPGDLVTVELMSGVSNTYNDPEKRIYNAVMELLDPFRKF